MSFDNDLNACAAIVEKGDPLRFRAAMAAPVAARRVLFPLYAFNVEVARAPWVTAEPMIAEMRLQWWRDALEEIAKGGPVRRHEVVTPLAGLLDAKKANRLDELVVARRWDIYKEPFEDAAHFEEHLTKTSSHLMQVSASLLGEADEAVVTDVGYAAGLAAWFRAIPALEAAGRFPLVDGRPDAIKALARSATDRLQQARTKRHLISRDAAPAFFPAIGAGRVLRIAFQSPARVADGQLPEATPWFTLRAAFRRW